MVIPVFNKERFVARAMRSVFQQSSPPDEIIIIDDASTDESLSQISFAFADPRVKLLRRTEPGPGGYAARNLGIRFATSDWVAFLDADDEWHADFVAEISALIAQASGETGCVFTGFRKTLGSERSWQDSYSRLNQRKGIRALDFDSFVACWLALGSSPIFTSACAIRKDVLVTAGLFPHARCRRGGDKDTWLRVMAHTSALSLPRECATYHKATENQVSRKEPFNAAPCMVETLHGMISLSTGSRRKLLKRLCNAEIFNYAVMVDTRSRVSPTVYQGFFILCSPVGYAIILGLAHLPRPARKVLRMSVVAVRRLGRLEL